MDPISPDAVLAYATQGATVTFSTVNTKPAPRSSISRWQVEFADGAMERGNGAPPRTLLHTYTLSGVYRIILSIWDTNGQSDTDQRVVTVDVPVSIATPIATYLAKTAGWYSTLIAAKPGQAPTGFQMGLFPTQVDIRRRHADGSIWQAQVTAKVVPGPIPILSATGVVGTFSPLIPSAQALINISSGEVTGQFVATMPQTISTDVWLNGPLVKEWRHIVTPMKGTLAHPTVRVIFDCRVFADGKPKVDVWFLNIKDSGTGKKIQADFEVIINGVSRLKEPCMVLLYGWWHREFYVGFSEADVAPDWTGHEQSGLLPKYDLSLPPDFGFPPDSSLVPLDDRMGVQDFWGEAGKRFELGYGLLATGISYLAHKTSGGKSHLKTMARQMGRWYGAVSLGDGIEPVDCLDQFPFFWSSSVFNPSPTMGNGPRNCNQTECSRDGQTHHNWENAHKCSPFYVAYLATGDRFFYDAQRLYGVDAILQTTPKPTPTHNTRKFSQGRMLDNFDWSLYANNQGKDSPSMDHEGMVMIPPSEGNQVRGMGRALTELVHASVITTSAQGGVWTAARWKEVVETNLDWLDLRAKVDIESSWAGPNPLKVPFAWMVGLHPNNDFNQSLSWTGTYLLFGIQIAIDTGHSRGVYARDAILNAELLPMRAATTEWKGGKRFSVGYQTPIYMTSYKHPTNPNHMFTSMAEAWGVSPGGTGTDAQFVNWPDLTLGGYGEEQRFLCALAKDLGHPDGAALLSWCDAFVGPSGTTIAQQLSSETRCGHNCYGTFKKK